MSGLWDQKDIPHKGWVCIDIQDLEDDRIFCQMCCGVEIRYAHIMTHPQYPEELTVGCECAAKMEYDYTAAKSREKKLKNKLNRRKKWLNRNWKTSTKGNDYINTDGFIIVVYKRKTMWTGNLKEKETEKNYPLSLYTSQEEAKLAVFDLLMELK